MTKEEAIKIIKDWKGFLNSSLEEALETLIPELRESEDERIRKALLDYILKCAITPESKTAFVAYLEKQKEQKPISFNESYNPDDYEVVMEGNATGLKRKEQKPEGVYVDCTEHPEWYGFPPKEQKPVEWGEDIIQKAIKEVGLTQHQINWFKTNVFPPKQEWSERDKEKLYQVIEILVADKLIALEEHPVCKSLHEAYDDMITFLKSLRPQPHWKPSEEQMEALLNTLHPDDPYYNELKSLYEQLQKL